jgi:hypothetical protein
VSNIFARDYGPARGSAGQHMQAKGCTNNAGFLSPHCARLLFVNMAISINYKNSLKNSSHKSTSQVCKVGALTRQGDVLHPLLRSSWRTRSTSDKASYGAHGLALLNEIRCGCCESRALSQKILVFSLTNIAYRKWALTLYNSCVGKYPFFIANLWQK